MIPREIASLVSWSRVVEEVGVAPSRNRRTRCLVHDGDNPHTFIFDDESGRAHCFSCGFHGDKIDFLKKVLGVDFKTALARLAEMAGVRLDNCKPNPRELRRAQAHRAALNAARNAYSQWRRHKFNQLVEIKFNRLLLGLQAAEAAYRALCRRSGLYSTSDAHFWIGRLGALYNKQAQLENDLDILFYRENEEACFQWYLADKRGVESERISA